LEGSVESVKELFEGFSRTPHQSYEHLVPVGSRRGAVNRADASERDIAMPLYQEIKVPACPPV